MRTAAFPRPALHERIIEIKGDRAALWCFKNQVHQHLLAIGLLFSVIMRTRNTESFTTLILWKIFLFSLGVQSGWRGILSSFCNRGNWSWREAEWRLESRGWGERVSSILVCTVVSLQHKLFPCTAVQVQCVPGCSRSSGTLSIQIFSKQETSELQKRSTKEIILALFLQTPISESLKIIFTWFYAIWGKNKVTKTNLPDGANPKELKCLVLKL